jgi:citrate lyase subunit alpha/citrate CoA-transferase
MKRLRRTMLYVPGNNPEEITGLGKLKSYHRFNKKELTKDTERLKERQTSPDRNKIVPTLEKAIHEAGLKDGMTISFHYHFRNGDYIVNMVLDTIVKLGIKDLVIASSSLTDIHAPLIHHINNGVIRRIESSRVSQK